MSNFHCFACSVKRFLVISAFLISTLFLPSVSHAECGEVSITEMNWASSQIITEVSKFIMENGYGCSVKKVPSATIPAVTSLAETGEPDIATEIWYNSAAIYPKLEEEGKVKTATHVLSDGGEEGWWIPAYLAEKHPELRTIQGVLDNPKLVGGRFHNCPVGWGCRITNDHYIIAYEFEKYSMEVFNHGSGETLAASIASAYSSKEPWFGYYWAPTAVLGKFPMVRVDVGPIDMDAHSCAQSKECKNPRKSAFPNAPVVTGLVSDFAESNPDIFELMSHVSFSNKTMNTLLAWKEKENATSEEAAVKFLTDYPDLWKGWINDQAKEKLAALLK